MPTRNCAGASPFSASVNVAVNAGVPVGRGGTIGRAVAAGAGDGAGAATCVATFGGPEVAPGKTPVTAGLLVAASAPARAFAGAFVEAGGPATTPATGLACTGVAAVAVVADDGAAGLGGVTDAAPTVAATVLVGFGAGAGEAGDMFAAVPAGLATGGRTVFAELVTVTPGLATPGSGGTGRPTALTLVSAVLARQARTVVTSNTRTTFQ